MFNINLISNTGIQLITLPLEINLNDNFKMFFHEWFDKANSELKLEIAHYFSSEDIWVRKHNLAFLGYVDKHGDVTSDWEDIQNDFKTSNYYPIQIETDLPEDSGCFQESASRIKWNKFENKWFPMPFFLLKGSKSEFGPTNWCRFKLIPNQINGKSRTYNLLIAFDTKSLFEKEDFEEEDLNEAPVFTNNYDKSKEYALCNNEYKLIAYCSDAFNVIGLDKYILKQFHELDDIKDYKGDKPKLKYLAEYIFLIRYIQRLNVVPGVTLFSNKNVEYSNVDLVVDIGNSRTCAVLFDNGDFEKMSPLELQDFTDPVTNNKLNKYIDSFDMRLAFRKADFGDNFGLVNSNQFVYPSMIRLGKEANRLIHKAVNENKGTEKTSTFSSPKRFLWDTKPQKQEWEFVQLKGEAAKSIYIKGVSEQLKYDGSLNTDGDGGVEMNYSRRALMTFAFLEILAQAQMQINSFEQRTHWGNVTMPRKINKIIVTCPTAMSRIEQGSLRKCAEDAAIILNRFFSETFYKEIDEKSARSEVKVIPSPKSISNKEEQLEWIFDEATAAQFVFLYAEINHRYKKNVKEYFDLYGKFRNDLGDYSKKSLTIGSVDIGAGTTDLMIAAYKYEDLNQCSLTPVPLFWESFYEAGDDLLKRLVQHLVIEGKYSPIEKKILDLQKNPVELMQPFLGTDVGVSFKNRKLRSDFNLQVSVPVVSYFLELLKNYEVESKVLTYSDIFSTTPPTTNVLNHFKEHFGFELESLQWTFEIKVVSAIVEKTFDILANKISSLLSFYDCDIVLLSGRPTSLKPLTDLFIKHFAISPNRLKTMNDYRVGRWYPEDKRDGRDRFVDGNGRFVNPKSIITTGAMIGHLASTGGLPGFSLNFKELNDRLKPNTNFFGRLNEQLKYTETIISLDNNIATLEIYSLPFRIGVRQLDVASYPSRPFYTLGFNEYRIEDRAKGRLQNENDINELQRGVNAIKEGILKKMPIKLAIARNTNEDIELLRIEEITDCEGNSIASNFLSLQVQSLSEPENFWLDSGIFSLNVNL